MHVRFVRREELAPSIWQYYFAPERQVDFVPGQYADFHILKPLNDPRGQARTFTLTSLPEEPELSFVVKIFGHHSPYKQALQDLVPGDSLRMDDAMGDLILPKLPDIPLVFVAGGIGVASYVSMLKQLLAQKQERPIFFFYALRSRREQIFRELTDAYPLQLKQVVFAPNQVGVQEITDSTPPGALMFLSGSQAFVENLRSGLEALGKPRSSIVFDYYDGYAEL